MDTNGEGFDIGDKEWDWGIYFGCPRDFHTGKDPDGNDDYYDNLMLLFALNIKCYKLQPTWYTVCGVGEFIKENLKVFKKFFNKHNREGYRPKDYKEADDPTVDAGFYEAYMQPMESLIAGNYSYSDYKELYFALGGK